MLRPVTLLVWLYALVSSPDRCNALSLKPQGSILVVGASGGTGPRALNGLLDVGYDPSQIRVLTRNVDKPSMVALRQMGMDTFQANLDEPNSSLLQEAASGCVGCYIHSTSSDTKKLDTAEVDRARNLAAAIAAQGDIGTVVYNSAAGEDDHGVYRIEQKHRVEQVFLKEYKSSSIGFTSLRANLFMEELWKGYTRPAILKGKYPFSIPRDRKIYLTSVRDMGRLAGTILKSNSPSDDYNNKYKNRIINVASDHLTPSEMAGAFAKAQKSPCVHDESKLFALLARLFLKDLHQVIQFYRTSTETTDIQSLQKEFPGLLTSFATFLDEAHWSNAELTYDDLNIAQETKAALTK